MGFMGSGKTAIAKAFSKKYQVPFLDTDRMIEIQKKQTIADIFKDLGEEAFRDLEGDLCRQLSRYSGHIISTGGGFMLHHENGEICKAMGPIVYLKTSLSVIKNRIENETHRPLALSSGTLSERYDARLSKYEALATVTINTDNKSIDHLVTELWTVYDSY